MKSRFTWFDLLTTDIPAALDFYTKGLGHRTQAWDGPMDYTMLASGEETYGGVMPLPADAKAMGAPPHWVGYVSVADRDAACARIEATGGRVYMRHDIPGVGRIAVAADNAGATFGLFEGTRTGPDGAVAEPQPIRAVTWHEVTVADLEAGWAFYSGLFGWEQVATMDMGPEMGEYRIFGHRDPAGDVQYGGMMKRPKDMPVCAWCYYFSVPDTDAATPRLQGLGARLLLGPMDVPGGDRVSMFFDPQGAAFAVHSRKA